MSANEKKWDAFLAKHASDEEIFMHKKNLKFLAREGIPPHHRPRLWFVFSGAFRKREEAKSSKRGYFQLVQESRYAETSNSEQIEKDLHRTGLKEYTTSPEMIEKLGRVLKAFAWRNPDMPETNAFWTLCSIIEDIMPKSYYDETMKALHVDIRVFSDLVKEKLSKLHQHILGLEIVLQPLTIIWFLGLFVHAAPEETVCRIWDSLFLEGSKMLFRAGLGLMKLKQRDVLDKQTFEAGYQVPRHPSDPLTLFQQKALMDPPSDPAVASEVMRIAFDKKWIGKFSMTKIVQLRTLHTIAVEEELEGVEQARQAHHARKKTTPSGGGGLETMTMTEERVQAKSVSEGAVGAEIVTEVVGVRGDIDSKVHADPPSTPGVAGDRYSASFQPAVPEKFSKVFDQLGVQGFNSGRRHSFALTVGYTAGPQMRRKGSVAPTSAPSSRPLSAFTKSVGPAAIDE